MPPSVTASREDRIRAVQNGLFSPFGMYYNSEMPPLPQVAVVGLLREAGVEYPALTAHGLENVLGGDTILAARNEARSIAERFRGDEMFAEASRYATQPRRFMAHATTAVRAMRLFATTPAAGTPRSEGSVWVWDSFQAELSGRVAVGAMVPFFLAELMAIAAERDELPLFGEDMPEAMSAIALMRHYDYRAAWEAAVVSAVLSGKYGVSSAAKVYWLGYIGATATIMELWTEFTDHLGTCNDCAVRVPSDDMTHLANGHEVCGECAENNYFSCESCGEMFDRDESNWTPSDEQYCGACFNRHCSYCSDCDTVYWRDDGGCDSCERHDGNYGDLHVYYYSYKPDPSFHRVIDGEVQGNFYLRLQDRGHEPFFGVELETNIRSGGDYAGGGSAIVRSPMYQNGFLYAKSDCTVSGPELVTHPATLEAHRKLWSTFPFEELAVQHRWSGWVGANAGMHVHVGRNAFRNVSHLARFQAFFGEWRDEMTAYAGRNCNAYGHHGTSMEGFRRALRYARLQDYPPRGSAINYQNHATVEVRMFRASLRFATVMAYIELLHGLVGYSWVKRSADIMHHDAMRFDTFFGWLEDNNDNGMYGNALRRIDERILNNTTEV